MFDWKKETNTVAITIYEADPNYGSTKELPFRSLTPWALNRSIAYIVTKNCENKSYTIDLVCGFQKDNDKCHTAAKNLLFMSHIVQNIELPVAISRESLKRMQEISNVIQLKRKRLIQKKK
eukprot:NODE_122_length_17689_cov_1.046219.p9 type:complete len:121 gc:universal NODE_122_length_17689_cov_1.046219:9004-9366(+)